MTIYFRKYLKMQKMFLKQAGHSKKLSPHSRSAPSTRNLMHYLQFSKTVVWLTVLTAEYL